MANLTQAKHDCSLRVNSARTVLMSVLKAILLNLGADSKCNCNSSQTTVSYGLPKPPL